MSLMPSRHLYLSSMTNAENQSGAADFNRRDFLRGGSIATMMAMLGGVELVAQTNEPAAEPKRPKKTVKVAVIGLGAWGRELLATLAKIGQVDEWVMPEVAAICDTYPAFLRRSASVAPGAVQTPDYKTILENKDIPCVIVATPTHQHKDLVLAALQAGKHVYCEAPLANTIDDAKTIALAAKAKPQQIFQAGLQMRADPQRHFLLPFIRSGALGKSVMARSQWHRKQSWRAISPNPEREKALNWRLYKTTSLGLVGELGIHPIDQATWFLNALPHAASGFGAINLWNEDDRDVPDTAQVVLEFPGGINMVYDATLANSFDGEYEMMYGSNAAVMMRDGKAWLFKEVDSPLLGWEVYAAKQTFYKDTGIALVAGASKSTPPSEALAQEQAVKAAPLYVALQRFLLNSDDLSKAVEDNKMALGDDVALINEQVAKVPRRPVAGYLDGYQSAVIAVKANEAVNTGKRVEWKPDLYELG